MYFPQLYCTVRKVFRHLFDDDKHKPCMGLCGHTICLACIKDNPETSCPECQMKGAFVNMTPNYNAIEIIESYRENSWKMFMERWEDEDPTRGKCSKCSTQGDRLRICLTCDSDHTCQWPIDMMRLKLRWLEDLLTLSKNVLCLECASNLHVNNGHKTVRVDSICFAKKDIQRQTAHFFLTLIRAGWRNKNKLMDCRMRKQNLKTIENSLDVMIMNLHDREDKRDHFGELIEIELAKKYLECFDSLETELSKNEDLKCECSRLYEKLERSGTNFHKKFNNMCLRGLYTSGCPLYSPKNEKQRLKLYSIINERPESSTTINTLVDSNCPLCIFMNYDKCLNKSSYRIGMSIFGNDWTGELPAYCLRCLEFFTLVGTQCKKCEEMKEEECHEHSLCVFYKYSAQSTYWIEMDYVYKRSKCLKYAVIYKLRRKIRKIMTAEIENFQNTCTLRKMRMVNTMHRLHYNLSKIDLERDTESDFLRRIEQVEKYSDSLLFQRNSYMLEAGNHPKQCICTAPMNYLEKTVKYLWETKHEKLESYRMLQIRLKFMVYKNPTVKKFGCPLVFSLSNEQKFSYPTSVRLFFSEFVAIFCVDDRLLMDSFRIKPHDVDYNLCEPFQNLFGLE